MRPWLTTQRGPDGDREPVPSGHDNDRLITEQPGRHRAFRGRHVNVGSGGFGGIGSKFVTKDPTAFAAANDLTFTSTNDSRRRFRLPTRASRLPKARRRDGSRAN